MYVLDDPISLAASWPGFYHVAVPFAGSGTMLYLTVLLGSTRISADFLEALNPKPNPRLIPEP